LSRKLSEEWAKIRENNKTGGAEARASNRTIQDQIEKMIEEHNGQGSQERSRQASGRILYNLSAPIGKETPIEEKNLVAGLEIEKAVDLMREEYLRRGGKDTNQWTGKGSKRKRTAFGERVLRLQKNIP
jgi:hypothetical protein